MANFVMTQGGENSISDLLNEYFGFGGAAGGGAGTTSGTGAGIGAIGAAIAATIIKDKTNKAHLENLKPGMKNQTIPDGIPSDLAEPGVQELPYLPNTNTLPNTEIKPIPIPNDIPSDLAEPGVQELPYLPNTGTAEKEETLPTIPPISEGLPNTEIKDETQTNIEQPISPTFDMQGMYDFILQQQQRQWDREDAIRKETQEREDTAYSRAISDLKKSGANINLLGSISPAASGGGITQATGLDYSPWTAEINKQLALVEQEIENNFKGDENSKDRLTKGLTSLLQLFSLMALKG